MCAHAHMCTHTQEYDSATKKETLPFAGTWMDPEGIMLSEVSHMEKDKRHHP